MCSSGKGCICRGATYSRIHTTTLLTHQKYSNINFNAKCTHAYTHTRIHLYERTNTHTQTCNCIQLGLSIYAIESQNMHTNHICSATTANINDVWPHMKRQRENKKNNKKLKCCAGFFCFGQNVIHLPAAAARTAHKADLKASLLHSMTFNHFACVCVAHMNLL